MSHRGITLRQLQILCTLRDAPPGSTLRMLGDQLGVTHVSVLIMLQKLHKRGLVSLHPRQVTQRGLAALNNAAEQLKSFGSSIEVAP